MLRINNLTKYYGKLCAIDNVSMELTNGIYALLGPNGAGKSTLINIICNNLLPSEGEILFDGVNIKNSGRDYRSILGYVPQEQALYDNFTADRFLYYISSLKGLSRLQVDSQITQLFEVLNLLPFRYKKIGTFSGGMKQRVLIAQALLGEPRLIILDEPTAGLDPKERISIRNLVSEISFNKIILFATHVVPDIEHISKDILMLKKGVLIRKGAANQLIKELDGKVYSILGDKGLINHLPAYLRVCNVAPSDNKIIIRVVDCSAESNSNITASIFKQQVDVTVIEPCLEDLYLYLYGD